MLLIWIVVAMMTGVGIAIIAYRRGQHATYDETIKLQKLQFDLLTQIQTLRDQYQTKIFENQSLYERLVAQDEVILNYQQELKRNDHLLDHLKTELLSISENYESLLEMKSDISQKVGILEQELQRHKVAKEQIFADLARTTDELYSLRMRLKQQILSSAKHSDDSSIKISS